MKIKKIFLLVLIIHIFTAHDSYAINALEKLFYKKDVIKVCSAKVLVNPLTNDIKYLWYETIPCGGSGRWEPVSGTIKDQFQAMYDQQTGKAKR